MSRRWFLLLVVVFVLFCPCSLSVSAEEAKVNIVMDNATVSYTPDGYYPSAKADAFSNEIKYTVTDNVTGKEVPLPVMAAGNYTVTAYMDKTDAHSAASCTASLTVEKAVVYISVTDTVVAHTAMDNPVKYTVQPQWAADMIEVTASYRAIKDYSDEGTEVAVPKDIGKYLVRMYGNAKNDNISCAGKYLVYEIAERAGTPLSAEDAVKSVPSSFTATVESINATYSVSYTAPKYHTNIAGVKSVLKYSHLYANGTIGAYTEELPTEPGDYVASCFVLDTVIGSGRIIIDKLTPKIEMSDASFIYTPEGVYPPAATVTPAGIDVVYKAYQYKNGVVGDSVMFPLTKCGTYLISACPKETSRYSFVMSYCYITIEKANPVFQAESLVYTEDGTPKPLQLTVEPAFTEYDVSYYRLADGKVVQLSDAPVTAGEYYATVGVKGSDSVNAVTKVYGIRILPAVSMVERVFSPVLKVLCVVFTIGVLVAGCYDILKHNKSRGV